MYHCHPHLGIYIRGLEEMDMSGHYALGTFESSSRSVKSIAQFWSRTT
jgi:hypothetical protein